MTSRPILTPAKRARYIAYATAVTIASLLIIDAIARTLEDSGNIDTQGDGSARTAYLAGNPWQVEGERVLLTKAASGSMIDRSFTAKKNGGWRAFMLGGSFLRGVPYSHAGTIHFWLDRLLKRHFPDQKVELINAAATAQNSFRVRSIAEHAATFDADIFIIATCNNEGALPPGEVTQRLQRNGTFRILKTLFSPKRSEIKRPLHTPQDPDIEAVRTAFRGNLEAMVSMAREHGIQVFLSTLPSNPRYDGNIPGRPIEGYQHPSEVKYPPCVERTKASLDRNETAKTITLAASCDHVESLRLAGFAHWKNGAYQRAKVLLDQYMEVEPRNRCRPSFQRIIREVAASQNVPLIDLESAINDASPHGVPGPELFVDYCHLNWQGQAIVADAMYQALLKYDAKPAGPATNGASEDRQAVFSRSSKDKPPSVW